MAYCECGCGQETQVAKKTRPALGHVRGTPLRFVNGHNTRGPRSWTVTDSGCWEWDGTLTVEGYGVLRENYRQIKAHRWVYEQRVGPIPNDLTIDHLCRNRRCVNPDHLEVVTHSENSSRARRGVSPTVRRVPVTHCKRGHEFTPDNTRVYRGSRHCRACARQRQRASPGDLSPAE